MSSVQQVTRYRNSRISNCCQFFHCLLLFRSETLMRFESLLVSVVCSNQTICNSFPENLSDENPVGTSADDEILRMPLLIESLNFKQYVDEEGKIFFHHWFVESQSNPAQDPVSLWLDGGPGCSSIGILSNRLVHFEPMPI